MRAVMAWGLMTATGDLRKFCQQCRENGVDTVRFFINYLEDSNRDHSPLPPYEIIGEWNPEGRGVVPVFDLEVINRDWYSRLNEVARVFAEFKLTPWVVFDDLCSEAPDGSSEQFNDPYYGSQQLWPGWREGVAKRAFAGGNQALELNPYREVLEALTLAAFRDNGCLRVYGEPKNEYGYAWGGAYTKADGMEWFKRRCDHLRKRGFDRVIGSWRDGVSPKDIEPFVDWLDYHQIIDPSDIKHPGIDKSKVILNTDGGYGDGLSSAWPIRTISMDEGFALGEAMARGGYDKSCVIFQELTWDMVSTQDLDHADFTPVMALHLARGWHRPIAVTICADSLMIANDHCPNVECKAFYDGEVAPDDVCSIHKAPDPPDPPKPQPKPCRYYLKRLNLKRWFPCALRWLWSLIWGKR